MMKQGRALIMALLACVLTGILAAWLFFIYTPVVSDPQGFRYIVKDGASLQSVRRDFQKLHLVNQPYFFDFLIYLTEKKQTLKAGEYLFPQGATPMSILKQIRQGAGMVYHQFTIISGWNFKQIRAALDKENLLKHTTKALTDLEIMTILKQPDLNPEGEFFPDTYYFATGSADIVLLKRSFAKMQNQLNIAWNAHLKNLPYKNSYEALIVASLIEKEARQNDERPIIAGVIVNRLNKNMLLQIDPTVIYGLGASYTGKIFKEDLHADTPYNTYLHKGLPPTPIAVPSRESLNAAMQPESHEYLYFVATGHDGRHQFSKTLQQHNTAVSEAKTVMTDFFNFTLVKKYFMQIFSPKLAGDFV